MESIVIPFGEDVIKSDLFRDCTNLTNVTLPNRITSIAPDAFRNCTSLEKIDIPNTVSLINYDAFKGCSSLSEILLPESTECIGTRSFIDCPGLRSVTILNPDVAIGEYAFGYCSPKDYLSSYEPLNNNMIIKGYAGSTAEAYAKENNLTFESISKEELSNAEDVTYSDSNEAETVGGYTEENSNDTNPAGPIAIGGAVIGAGVVTTAIVMKKKRR